jgi:hypothetical protein
MGDLMQITMVCNMAIQQVHALEAQFIQSNPKVTSFYHILAQIAYRNSVEDVQVEFLSKSPVGDTVTEDDIYVFLGELLEASFRSPQDPHNRYEEIVDTYAAQWQIPRDKLEPFADSMRQTILNEPPIGLERVSPKYLHVPNHVLLSPWPYICGPRSLLHVHRMVQLCSGSIQPNTKLPPQHPTPGNPWNETTHRATQLVHDLDAHFLLHILPDIVAAVCSDHHLLSQDLPRMYQLMPLFSLVRTWIQHLDQPLPLSVSFAFHAVLSGIFELQGEGNLAWLAQLSQVRN